MSPTRNKFLNLVNRHPAEVIAASFILTALLGSLLLITPAAAGKGPVGWVDAFFTATSAVCVTGLITVDTGTQFSPFGQAVILGLIQAGGLGIMTYAVILATVSGRKISLSGRTIMEQSFMPQPQAVIYGLTRIIVLSTLLIEGVGAVLLYLFHPGGGVFAAVFHSISAFCNAGFCLYADSLTRFRGHLGVNLTITSLIILGGLGFFVIFEVLHHTGSRKRHKLSLHSKLVLAVTAGLLLLGTVVFFLFEHQNLLDGLPLGEQLLAAFFQSVTPRTAGFNTVDFGKATGATLLFTILLMFVGASPGSTGGGVKTTSLGVMIALAKSKLKGREDVDIFRATVSSRAVARTLSVTILAGFIIVMFLVAFLWVEIGPRPFGHHEHRVLEYLFEITSAFGTVGLSTGITASLSVFGKLMLCVVMFIGRIGPLTIAHAVGRRYGQGKFRYPEERVMIG
ncbi:MAG TPA: potassium transporter TrkG [Acidobacteriota bacterium]|nr:Trk family potassium uptake protein [Acidobacteriota bacterium]HNR39096.1 potassium transporter TrkG [Acidobacteriota bacterium]HNU01585.1 potassium transporter TrkG [Acidobacteriota bacterium]HPB29691.1 potassium transporter TrkG [Acidobacteriota bacterium]